MVSRIRVLLCMVMVTIHGSANPKPLMLAKNITLPHSSHCMWSI